MVRGITGAQCGVAASSFSLPASHTIIAGTHFITGLLEMVAWAAIGVWSGSHHWVCTPCGCVRRCATMVLWDDTQERLCGPHRWLIRARVAQAVRSRPRPSAGRLQSTYGPSVSPWIRACIFSLSTAVWMVCGGVSSGSLLVRFEVPANAC